jgi:mono/diheme cytochrome c family protein
MERIGFPKQAQLPEWIHMIKRLLMGVAAAGLLMACGYANDSGKMKLNVNSTNPTDGKQMYMSYCAPCHGNDGRGNGPVAGALKSQPTDLTALARAHNGKYPDTHVYSVLAFGSAVPAHGNAQMPVWGTILGNMAQGHPAEQQLRLTNLSRYIESMQAR